MYHSIRIGVLILVLMELPDLFRVIRMRGIYMQEAYPEGGAMASC